MNQSIPISSIIYEPFEVEEDVLAPIRESIKEQGLHHSLLVKEFWIENNHCQSDYKKFQLIAGKKRLRALEQLGITEVNVKILDPNLTETQCKEYALHENLRRANLPWYDIVQLEKELHDLRVIQHGKAVQGNGSKEGQWKRSDTARELGISVGKLSEDMSLALAVETNPSLRNVKDRQTALRLIKNETKRIENEKYSLLPPEFEMNQIYLGDSLEIMKHFPDSTFDACITDPPWSDYKRDLSLTSSVNELIPHFTEVYRLLKHDSFLYLICSSNDFYDYKVELKKIGFTVQDYPIIWQKTKTITHGRRQWQYARDYEPILLAVKGNPLLTSGVEFSSVLKYDNVNSGKLIHPNEKPIELINAIINQCTFSGGKILEPFAGSGVTLEAAKLNKRYYIGIEKNKDFYDKIVKRLSGDK
jgi:DNA modification methylase/ParB-like chromosome segregation protein Spo0J